MYRSYEDSENSSDSSGISEMSGINGAAESVVGEVSNQYPRPQVQEQRTPKFPLPRLVIGQAAECKHEVNAWKILFRATHILL